MSLIDEALKRARQEAARQDEAARELRYRQVPVIPGLRQPARRSWLLPVVIAACLAVGIGIGLFLSGRRGEDQRAAAPPPPVAPAAAPVPAVPEPPPQTVQEAAPAALPSPVIEEEPEAVAENPAPEAPVPLVRPVQEEEPEIADMREREIVLNPAAARPQRAPEPLASEPPAPVAPEPAPAAPEPAAPAPVVAAGQERIYQQEMPLAGGGTLRLNGIAYSERPVALFGDKVVGPGESVAGYKVVSIEPRRVRLEGQGGVVVVEMP
jgi:hypothetical protein